MPKVAEIENRIAHAFAIEVEVTELDLTWAFQRDHLIYATQGLVEIETDSASWRLPGNRAVWMKGQQTGRCLSKGPFKGVSIFFDQETVHPSITQCRVFEISNLAREMILHAHDWGPDRDPEDKSGDRYFHTLADLCFKLMHKPETLCLPKAKSKVVQSVLDKTVSEIASPITFSDLVPAANMSERNLARRIQSEIHMSWRQYQTRARMIHAMDLLARGKTISTTALEVGFQNLGAFSTAFGKTTGQTPSQYQKQFA